MYQLKSNLPNIIINNIVIFSGAAIFLFYMGRLGAYSRLAFIYFLVLDCCFMFVVHYLWKRVMPSLYWRMGLAKKILLVADRNHAAKLLHDIKNKGSFGYDLLGLIPVGEEMKNFVTGIRRMNCYFPIGIFIKTLLFY